MGAAMKVLIPWKTPLYRNLNGYHPLLASLIDAAPENLEFVVPEGEGSFNSESYYRIISETARQGAKFGEIFVKSVPHIDADKYLSDFLWSRNPAMQMFLDTFAPDVDLVLHHTTPVHMMSIPFVCHLENIETLFFPGLEKRSHHTINLRAEPIFDFIKWQLESDNCRGVFTHLKRTYETLNRCFNSEKIARKIRYIPLGVAVPPSFRERIDSKIAGIRERKGG